MVQATKTSSRIYVWRNSIHQQAPRLHNFGNTTINGAEVFDNKADTTFSPSWGTSKQPGGTLIGEENDCSTISSREERT